MFYDEMNGYDFDLFFSGTEHDFQKLQQTFVSLGVTPDQVRLIMRNDLEDAEIKSNEIRKLIEWLKENRNRQFDFDDFDDANRGLLEETFSCIVIRGKDEVPEDLAFTLENVKSVDEIAGTNLKYVPIVFVIEAETIQLFRNDLLTLLGRKDVEQNQLFFCISPAMDKEYVVRFICDLGIEEPRLISRIDDGNVTTYIKNYPMVAYVGEVIHVFENEVNILDDHLKSKNEQSAIENAEVYEQISALEDVIEKIKASDLRFVDLDNYSGGNCFNNLKTELPDYKYVPMRDVREAMYPEKMTTEQLAEAIDEIAEAFDPYEYRDNVEMGENTVQEVMLDLQSCNIHYYVSYLKDIVDEECDLSVRAGVLMERLKTYEPEFPKDMEPMVYVNYCEKSELGNPRCQKLSDLDSRTVEQDKAWYADRDPNTNEPKTTAQMFFTVYYAEKGDKMLHHFQGKIDIGTGNGGIISQLKMQNEMKLTDESWISYQQGKGNEAYQKYMEDLTDMQNHVLPYLQSFCSLEEKGVQERREQQVADKKESRVTAVTGVEKQANAKEARKAEKKSVPQKKATVGKEKKPSIHERLEINKKIIQEKQGKDKPEKGVDLGVRTV